MSKQYNTKLQERLEKFLKDENLSQAKAAPILGISQAALSQYRRSMYDKGDIEAVENKLKEFFQIQEEKTQNAQKAEPFRTKTSAGYIPTTISEEAYKLIRYCQLEKGIVVIDGDAGIGKTKAAAKFLQDNPSTTVYVKATPSTGSTRSLLKMIAKTWLKSAKIKDVGAYFAVSDAPQEISAWDSRLQVTSRGYMLGYNDLKDPSVSGFFRFLAKIGDGMMKMQIVKIRFGGKQ